MGAGEAAAGRERLTAPRVQAGELERFTAGIVTAMGAPPDVSGEVARHLVGANLAGHDSHGVMRLAQYAAELNSGTLVPAARATLLHERGSTALFDANQGFGHHSTMVALEWAARSARRDGVAAGAIRHSNHIGRLGTYAERAADEGLIALVTVGSAGPGIGSVAPFGSSSRFLGTNPWAIGVPAGEHPAMIFDAATSAVAEGKVRLARAKGANVPPESLISPDGRPSRDPNDLYAGGALLPLGGSVAGHKGYGLALAAALLGGLAIIDDPAPNTAGTSSPSTAEAGWTAGVFLLLLDPASFGDPPRFAEMVASTLDNARSLPCAPGFESVLVAGDPERRNRQRRASEGIEIPPATWQELGELAIRFGVSLPGES